MKVIIPASLALILVKYRGSSFSTCIDSTESHMVFAITPTTSVIVATGTESGKLTYTLEIMESIS